MEKNFADFLGDPRKIAEDLRNYRREMIFVDKNHVQLLISYPERWIAVIDKRVVADSENVNELVESVEAQGLERASVCVKFMTKNPPTLILTAA